MKSIVPRAHDVLKDHIEDIRYYLDSQVMPSGCHLRRVALPAPDQLALADRPSASDYHEEQLTISPDEMRAAVTTPVFQPYRGETGRAWMAKEYGVIMDTSSLMSSETERDDSDDESHSTLDLNPTSQ